MVGFLTGGTFKLFIFLQILDGLTTWIGLRLGLSEASPFIRLLMQLGPAAGLVLAKSVALLLCFFCFSLGRARLVGRINYFFSVLVLWNLVLIATIL